MKSNLPTWPRFLLLVAILAHFPLPAPSQSLELAGMSVIPHTQSSEMRYRRDPDPQLGARVQLFLRNRSDQPITLPPDIPLTFRGKSPANLLTNAEWTWHDTPSAWTNAPLRLPAGALTVWTFNSRGTNWGIGTTADTTLHWPGQEPQRIPFSIDPPRVWISALTFLGPDGGPFPDTLVAHVANRAGTPIRLVGCRLWLPESNRAWRSLLPAPALPQPVVLPANGTVAPADQGILRVATGRLPLTYAAVEVLIVDPDGKPASLWAHLRIKKESFDISGGWVASGVGGSNTLHSVAYLKTLRRMHVNAGMHDAVPGYTDNPALFDAYPLKYMNRCLPLERFDADEILPRIHAVEFLGEPQYGGGRPVPPMEVWLAFAPYQATRLPTSVTHSEERIWRYYAGLSDYPHYDAYRVGAPSPDAWSRYDRWGGESLRWGAPLETIGDMTRSLRDLNRPMPIAYWSQGAHDGWGRYGGRQRTSPTPDELRLQAYHGLANRITSLYWFNLSAKSLVKFRDLIQPITEVGREIRLMQDLLLEGDAFEYNRLRQPDGSLDWDISSVVGPRGGVLFALDLRYRPDANSKVFVFGEPRPVTCRFRLPAYLRNVGDVFRFDAQGVRDVAWAVAGDGVEIRDSASRAALYIVAPDASLRASFERHLRELREMEDRLGFDPAHNDQDFAKLTRLAGSP